MTAFPVILSAPSGGGKTTIAKMLLQRRDDVGYSVSCTTRTPRPDEVEGRDYFFRSPEQFAAAAAAGEFAEHAMVHGNMYGTLRSEVARVLGEGRHVVMDIDVQGARQFARAYPESVLVFLVPPSADVLCGRLAARKTESRGVFERRVRAALDELRAASEYHYLIVNDDLEATYRQVSAVVDAETVCHRREVLLATRVRDVASDLERRVAGFDSTSPE